MKNQAFLSLGAWYSTAKKKTDSEASRHMGILSALYLDSFFYLQSQARPESTL